MYRFFVDKSQIDTIDNKVEILGADVNHIKNVLRMKQGEEIAVSDGESAAEYRCRIDDFESDRVVCTLCFVKEADTELCAKVYLFQGLPKQDKMELVVQKAVELGAFEVIPVACHRSIVKLDAKKGASKVSRWCSIAEAAAKQAKRGIIPVVHDVLSFKAALEYAKDNCDVILLPYELASSDKDSMEETTKLIMSLRGKCNSIAVFIGPEGGFEGSEVEAAKLVGANLITLGRRILRTETAGMTVLSWLVLALGG